MRHLNVTLDGVRARVVRARHVVHPPRAVRRAHGVGARLALPLEPLSGLVTRLASQPVLRPVFAALATQLLSRGLRSLVEKTRGAEAQPGAESEPGFSEPGFSAPALAAPVADPVANGGAGGAMVVVVAGGGCGCGYR